MAARKPLVLNGAQTQQVQPGDLVDAAALLSADPSNVLARSGSDGGIEWVGVIPSTTIAVGATTPVPPGNAPTVLYSTQSGCYVGWSPAQQKWLAVSQSAYSSSGLTTTSSGVNTTST